MKQLLLILFTLFFIAPVIGQNSTKSFNNYSNASFNELGTETDLNIFPNPSKQDKVTVKFNKYEIKEITITNILGKEVLVKQYTIAEKEKQLELNNIPDGIYLVRVKTADGQIVVKKLMVSKN